MMEPLKKTGKALLFPPIWLMILLTPIAAAALICSMIILGTDSIISYIAYAFSAYMLTVWCIRIPKLIELIKRFKNENKYAVRWRADVRLRVNFSLLGSFIWNISYASLLLGLGIYHSSFWFYSMAGYYASLAIMRYFLGRHMRKHKPGELMRDEFIKYRACGIIFLIMNLSLTVMIIFMVYLNKSSEHTEITTIAMAAYTFTTFTFAIINIIKYKKYQSPVISASKAIELAAASVSMLTLTSTMLSTFGEQDTDEVLRRVLLGSVSAAALIFIISMAIYMIVTSTKELRTTREQIKSEDKYG